MLVLGNNRRFANGRFAIKATAGDAEQRENSNSKNEIFLHMTLHFHSGLEGPTNLG